MADAASGTAGWFPALTTLLGFAAASIRDFLRDHRTSSRDREARNAARRAQLFERRATFQRETLTDLQDAVVKLTRAAGKMHHLDEMESRKTGKWGGNLFPEELSESALEVGATIMVLTARVRDDRIRQLVTSFRLQANKVGVTRTNEASREALMQMVAILEPLHERIGEVLRKLDDDEDAQQSVDS